MQNAAQAYSTTAKQTVAPREREASLLIKAAAQLQNNQDNAIEDRSSLRSALHYNRKLWTVLVTSATQPENPLPLPIKNNIASLGVFIFRHTMEVLARPEPQKLKVLISINKEIAAGLRSQ